MIEFSRRAQRQLAELFRHFARQRRSEAALNLIAAVDQAVARRQNGSTGMLPAPRPYPDLASAGRCWTKVGRYWVCFTISDPPILLLIFHDTADIPGRI